MRLAQTWCFCNVRALAKNNIALFSSMVNLDNELLSIAAMNDETERKQNFESFVLFKLSSEKQLWPHLKINNLPFVQEVNDSFDKLARSIQDKGDVSGSDEALSLQEQFKWNFVDMLIQFKLLVKRSEGGYNAENLSSNKAGSCGLCNLCSGTSSCKSDNEIASVKTSNAIEWNL